MPGITILRPSPSDKKLKLTIYLYKKKENKQAEGSIRGEQATIDVDVRKKIIPGLRC